MKRFSLLYGATSLLLLLAVSVTFAPAAGTTAPCQEGPLLRIQLNPLLNLFQTVNHAIRQPKDRPAIAGFDRAVEVVKELRSQRMLGFRNYLKYWDLEQPHIEGELTEYNSAAEALTGLARLPEKVRLKNGKAVALRKEALRLVNALAVAEPQYLEALWPKQRAALENGRASIERSLFPKQGKIIEFLERTLNMRISGGTVPVYLTFRSEISGKTIYGHGGKAVCLVRIESEDGRRISHRLEPVLGSRWQEVVVHEVIHALDTKTLSTQKTALVEIRRRLGEKESSADGLWHLLIFIEAHEAIRRFVDPTHRLESHSNYKRRLESRRRLGPWLDYLDGKSSRRNAIDTIVERNKSDI